MPSALATLTVDEKTLLHLSQFVFSADEEAPHEATQDGIAEATGISTTHVPRSVQGLRKKGLVDELKMMVSGGDRRRKVYLPTDDGYRRAQELKTRLLDASLVVRDPDGSIRETTLSALYGNAVTVNQVLQVVSQAEAVPLIAVGDKPVRHPSPTASNLYTRIPTVSGFVGRKDDLKAFTAAMKDPKVRLIVITGIAGIGKTTLVARGLQRVKRESVFWYRLHEWETLRNLGFIMGDFLATLGKPDVKAYMEGHEEHDVAEAYEIVQGALEGLEALLVFDDFDKAPRSLVAFVRTFLPQLDRFTGIKFVAMARTAVPFFSETDRIEGRVAEIALTGLDEDDARRLLPQPKDPRADQLTKMAEGHPLLLKLFANIDPEVSPVAPTETLVHAEGLVRFVNEEILGNLSMAEQAALERISVHRQPVPPEILVGDTIDFDVLDSLRRKQLLRSVGGRFVEPVDFVREFVYQRLKPETKQAAHAAAAAALRGARIPGAGREAPRHLLLAGQPNEAAEVARKTADRYLEEGKTEELGALLRDLLDTPGLPPAQAASLAELRARLYEEVGDAKRASLWREKAKAYQAGSPLPEAR